MTLNKPVGFRATVSCTLWMAARLNGFLFGDAVSNGLILPRHDGALVAFQTSEEIRHALPEISDQYDYQRMVGAIRNAVKTHELAVADLESQVAIAETLPEAMQRGQVTADGDGYYSLSTVLSEEDSVKVDGASINRWRKLAAIPREQRLKYYADMKAENKKPSRNGIIKWHLESIEEPKRYVETGTLECLEDSGPFSTVYADPPWQYGNQGTRAATNNHYPTMDIGDICELPVKDIVSDKALLFVWTTNGFLEQTLTEVIPAWGFTFKSSMVWVKPQMGIGNYVRNAHEFLLIANRGGLLPNGRNQISWIQADRKSHSEKPDAFRKVVEDIAPSPRIELFSRREMPGWTSWGNQVLPAEKTLLT